MKKIVYKLYSKHYFKNEVGIRVGEREREVNRFIKCLDNGGQGQIFGIKILVLFFDIMLYADDGFSFLQEHRNHFFFGQNVLV